MTQKITSNRRPITLAFAALLAGLFTAAPLPAAEVEVVNPAGRPVLAEGKKPLAMSGYSPIF